jgi:hypothetical protein
MEDDVWSLEDHTCHLKSMGTYNLLVFFKKTKLLITRKITMKIQNIPWTSTFFFFAFKHNLVFILCNQSGKKPESAWIQFFYFILMIFKSF